MEDHYGYIKFRVSGFTLIELLAVIVILAIIALIAMPIVLNIINSSKENAIKRSKDLYLNAVEQGVARKNLSDEFNPKECIVQLDGNLKCPIGSDVIDLIIETTGERPCKGSIIFKNGKIETETIEYCDDSSRPKYTELEYLESTGEQYIDTGYIVNIDNYAKIRFIVDTTIFPTSSYAFNGIGNASINAFLVGIVHNDIRYGVGSEVSTYINYSNNRAIFDLDVKNNKYTVFDTVTEEYLVNLNTLVINKPGFDKTQSSLILFGYLRASHPTGEYRRLHKAQIYGCKIYEDDRLVRDFIPILDNKGIPCMYDKVEGKFYYNSGTGAFLYN